MTWLVVPSDPTVPVPRCRSATHDDPPSPPPAGAVGEEPVTVRVVGDLDAASAADWADVLGTAVENAAAAGGTGGTASPPAVACDLRAVEFLSTAGVSALLEVAAHAAAHGVPYSVVAVSRPVVRVLGLTGTAARVGAAPGTGPVGRTPATACPRARHAHG